MRVNVRLRTVSLSRKMQRYGPLSLSSQHQSHHLWLYIDEQFGEVTKNKRVTLIQLSWEVFNLILMTTSWSRLMLTQY